MDQNDAAPPGYYYQPPGGGFAQYIGRSVPSNFELPPMLPHRVDPNYPTPMPGFYFIDSYGHPPEYLGVNPPKRARRPMQTPVASQSSAGSRPPGTSSTQSTYRQNPSNYEQSRSAPEESYIEYTVVERVPPNAKDAYIYRETRQIPPISGSNQPGYDCTRNQQRIIPTNESSASMDYIPPFNTRPYTGPSHEAPSDSNQSYSSTLQFYGINPPYSGSNQRYSGSNQQYSSNQRRVIPTNESSASMDYSPPFNTRPQFMPQEPSRFAPEYHHSNQYPQNSSGKAMNYSDSLNIRRNDLQEDNASDAFNPQYYKETISVPHRSIPNQQNSSSFPDQQDSSSFPNQQNSSSFPSQQNSSSSSNQRNSNSRYESRQDSFQDSEYNTMYAGPSTQASKLQRQGHNNQWHSHGGLRFGY